MNTFVIANPSSRLGETGRRLTELRALLSKHLGPYVLLETQREGDGERLAQEARARGASRIVVAGGDGTVSEVLTGLIATEGHTDIPLGILPLGTGRDFARLLGLGTELETAVARLRYGHTRRVDAGRLRARGPDGAERVRCFMNIASLGLSGESALWLKQEAVRGTRGPLSYIMSSFVGLSRYSAPRIALKLDGVLVHDASLTLAAVANGQYFAGGMQVAPEASIDDGAFDVIVVPRLSLLESLSRLPLLLRGRHVDGRKIRVHRGRVLEATSAATVWIEADGEPVATLPARFELLPHAVTLCGLP